MRVGSFNKWRPRILNKAGWILLQLALLACLLGWAVIAPAGQDLVSIEGPSGVQVGRLVTVEDRAAAGPTFLLVHGSWAHFEMELITYLQDLLKAAGFDSLAINLHLGVDDRRGALSCDAPVTARFDAAPKEIESWVRWLSERTQRIVLFGHSRGGLQVASLAPDTLRALGVEAVVMAAPMMVAWDARRAHYQRAFGEPLAAVLARADAAGDGFLRAGLVNCAAAEVRGTSFQSYYGAGVSLDVLDYLAALPKPGLIVYGSEDPGFARFIEIQDPLQTLQHIDLQTLEGADHFFRDLYADDLVERVLQWLP